ncbi:DNA-binding protein YbaB [Nocardia kruczakiae]|uniref:DNA-binding protein YbaB n=1 Tax=Nocardia kruczakiae TaxID=261477 RepID=A0ABU1XEU2_9NOCA|nr:YbaB/EbfC family nucleoid-associated protein [Nocardia kruczakiae]MDR7169055.1 DNA-binding protein YbaB [Nocardia kruczakiae]
MTDPLVPDDNEIRRQARMEINHMLDVYEEQKARLTEIHAHLDSVRIQARSVDGTVEVSVDSAGIVTGITLQPAALRNKPDDLARKLTEVIREAATHAEKYTLDAMTPVTEIVGTLPDLPDLIPGAPSLREPFPADTAEGFAGHDDAP